MNFNSLTEIQIVSLICVNIYSLYSFTYLKNNVQNKCLHAGNWVKVIYPAVNNISDLEVINSPLLSSFLKECTF